MPTGADAHLPVAPTALRAGMVCQTAFAQARSVLEIDDDGARGVGAVWRRLNGERPQAVASADDDLARVRRTLSFAPGA